MRFTYDEARVKDLRAEVTVDSKTGKHTVHTMRVKDEPLDPSPRFWVSLQARFGFSRNIFKYFGYDEVFGRISEVSPDDKLRIVVQRGESEDSRGSLLAVSNPKNQCIQHDDLMGLLDKNGVDIKAIDYGTRQFRPRPVADDNIPPHTIAGPGDSHFQAIADRLPTISYSNGIIRSLHTPRNTGQFDIGGDAFANRFVMDSPIDGYGKPSIYLMLLRMICSNGAIGFTSAFRSEIAMGKGEDTFDYALTRAMEGFNNEDGFLAMRDRYESSTKSWASINETNKLYKLLARLHGRGQLRVKKKFLTLEKSGTDGADLMHGSPIFQGFHKMTGDLTRTYGLANLDALSVKRQRTLPAGCKMYDLLNFASETATHYATPSGASDLQAYIGDLIAAEFDLEGTADKFGDWKDFLVTDKTATESLAIAQKK